MTVKRSQTSEEAVRLRTSSETANLARVRTAVIEQAQDLGFPESEVSQIALAVDEALANVIKHGYDSCPGQPIDITLERVGRPDGRGLQVTVCDCGRQVDPTTIVGRHLDDVRPGGLGTHIIRKVMDEVEYSLRQPAGMKLRMVKMLKSGLTGGDPVGQAGEDGVNAQL